MSPSSPCGEPVEAEMESSVLMVELSDSDPTNYPEPPAVSAAASIGQRRKASRSALIVSACVVGMPWGKPLYVLSVPFCTSLADRGPESA